MATMVEAVMASGVSEIADLFAMVFGSDAAVLEDEFREGCARDGVFCCFETAVHYVVGHFGDDVAAWMERGSR